MPSIKTDSVAMLGPGKVMEASESTRTVAEVTPGRLRGPEVAGRSKTVLVGMLAVLVAHQTG